MAKSFDTELQRVLRQEMQLEQSLLPRRQPGRSRSERAAGKVVAKWLRDSKLDTKALSALRDQYQPEARRSNESLKVLGARHGAAQRKGVVNDAKAVRAVVKRGITPAVTSIEVLERARLIRMFPNAAFLQESRTRRGDNFARILVKRRDRARDRLSFVFEWRNRSGAPAMIDAVATLAASGFLTLGVDNGLLGNVGIMDVTARISIRQDPFNIFVGASGTAPVGAVIAFNYPWAPAADGQSTASVALELSARGHRVGAGQSAAITVSLTVHSDFSDGDGTADFSSGLLGVSCPQVVVTIHQNPLPLTQDRR